jgi:hypothetical protein
LDIIEAVLAFDSPDWLCVVFTEKFGNMLYDTRLFSPNEVNDDEFAASCVCFCGLRLPQGPSFHRAYEQAYMSPSRQAGLNALLDLGKSFDPNRHPDENSAHSY